MTRLAELLEVVKKKYGESNNYPDFFHRVEKFAEGDIDLLEAYIDPLIEYLYVLKANPEENFGLFESVLHRLSEEFSYFASMYDFHEWMTDAGDNCTIASSLFIKKLERLFSWLQAEGASLQNNPELFDRAFSILTVSNKIPSEEDIEEDINKIKAGFQFLKDYYATLHENSSLFAVVISNKNLLSRETATIFFDTLLEHKITLKENERLYTKAILLATKEDSEKQIDAFKDIVSIVAGMELTLHKRQQLLSLISKGDIFERLIALSNKGDMEHRLEKFLTLIDLGASFEHNETLFYYDELTKNQLIHLLEELNQSETTKRNSLALLDVLRTTRPDWDSLLSVFNSLQNAGLTPNENLDMFKMISQHADSASEYQKAIARLEQHGLPLTEIRTFFDFIGIAKNRGKLEEYVRSNNGLADIFDIILASGLKFDQHIEQIEHIFRSNNSLVHKEELLAMFNVFQKHKLSPEDYHFLIKRILDKGNYANGMSHAFDILLAHGFSLTKNKTLFNDLLEKTPLQTTAFVLDALVSLGETDQTARLIERVVKTNIEHGELAKIGNLFVRFKALGITAPDNFKAIEYILKNSDVAAVTAEILDWLENNNILPGDHPEVFARFFSGNAPAIINQVSRKDLITALKKYVAQHGPLVTRTHKDYDTQSKALKQVIASSEEVFGNFTAITEGPLMRSEATELFQNMLARIASSPGEKVDIRYDAALGYIVQFDSEPPLYLSQLLPYVNFNHVSLSAEQLSCFAMKILPMKDKFSGSGFAIDKNMIMSQMPDCVRDAIKIYTDYAYKNINALFRGEPLDASFTYSKNMDIHDNSNLMAIFITGCLVNWAAAELPRQLYKNEHRMLLEAVFQKISTPTLADCRKDKSQYDNLLNSAVMEGVIDSTQAAELGKLYDQLKYFFPDDTVSVRKEYFVKAKEAGAPDTLAQREVNPTTTIAATSISVLSQGVEAYSPENLTVTKFQNRGNSAHVVFNDREGEYLLPSGTTVLYARDEEKDGEFWAREVNSPGLTPSGDYWSSFALSQAYEKYLKKSYQDRPSSVRLEVNDPADAGKKTEVVVQRPNHGLAHEFRVMSYIDVVIDYFAKHAKDATFKVFCQRLSPEERAWLRVAAAFSITGRESEIAAVEDLKLYDSYREACKLHMEEFLESYPPPHGENDLHMKERMLDVVRWMGNPFYETKQNSPAEHGSLEYHHRNFLHRILTTAHKLDLPRCYDEKQFSMAMNKCRELSGLELDNGNTSNLRSAPKPNDLPAESTASTTASSNPKKQEQSIAHMDFLRMIGYAIDLNRAHGGTLTTTLSKEGNLQACNEGYRHPFARVSTSLREVCLVTETVQRPKLLESYQFNQDVDRSVVHEVLMMIGGPDAQNELITFVMQHSGENRRALLQSLMDERQSVEIIKGMSAKKLVDMLADLNNPAFTQCLDALNDLLAPDKKLVSVSSNSSERREFSLMDLKTTACIETASIDSKINQGLHNQRRIKECLLDLKKGDTDLSSDQLSKKPGI